MAPTVWICAIMFSPYVYPVTAQTFNFASPVFAAVTLMGVISWWIVPEERWLSKEFIQQAQAGIEITSEAGSEKGVN